MIGGKIISSFNVTPNFVFSTIGSMLCCSVLPKCKLLSCLISGDMGSTRLLFTL